MPIQGEEPLEEHLEWLKYGRQMIQESPKVLDEAAKSFLTLNAYLLTLYTGARISEINPSLVKSAQARRLRHERMPSLQLSRRKGYRERKWSIQITVPVQRSAYEQAPSDAGATFV